MSNNIQNPGEEQESKFSVVDDDSNQNVHVVKFTTSDGIIGNIYVEVNDDELREAIEEFNGPHHQNEKLSFFSSEAIALNVRDRLRSVAIREKIIELAEKKKKLMPEFWELESLQERVDFSEYPALGLEKRKSDVESQLKELEDEFDKLIVRSEDV